MASMGYRKSIKNHHSLKDKDSSISLYFKKKKYKGSIYRTKNSYRLTFEKELNERLKEVYAMSYMRTIENSLRASKPEYENSKIEDEIPFWEFIDIEFDSKNKTAYFVAHYVQKPIFIELFKEIVNSHILFDIEETLDSKNGLRIIKEKWKPKEKLKIQVDAKNVIYNLIDVNNKQFYIGEAESLVNRLSGRRNEIPNWTHYRFDSLPNGLSKLQRLSIERLLIRSFASFIPNSKGIDSMDISDYHITNKKIDN